MNTRPSSKRKIDQFYIDDFGNFRGLIYKIESFHIPASQVVYDPTEATVTIEGEEFSLGKDMWENGNTVLNLPQKPIVEPTP